MPAFNVAELLRTLLLIDLDVKSAAGKVQSYRDFVSHNRYSEFWKQFSLEGEYRKFQMPVLLIGGWYDYYPSEMLKIFCELKKHSETKQVAESRRIIIGPLIHGINQLTTLGEINCGEEALKENDATIRWLECILHEGEISVSFRKHLSEYLLLVRTSGVMNMSGHRQG